jgi:predicted metalloprotease
MITDEELKAKIEEVCEDYHGGGDDLAMIVGMVVVGRYYGSRIMRLVSSKRHWALMQKHFGDFHEVMDDKGDDRFYQKSFAVKVIDTATDYWRVISGHKAMPLQDKKRLVGGATEGATK